MCRRGEYCIFHNVKAFDAALTYKTLKNPKIYDIEDEQQIKNLLFILPVIKYQHVTKPSPPHSPSFNSTF